MESLDLIGNWMDAVIRNGYTKFARASSAPEIAVNLLLIYN